MLTLSQGHGETMTVRLRRLLGGRRIDPRLKRQKLRAIDAAFDSVDIATLVDLGAVWAVDGGYAFYALDQHGARRVVICDEAFTEPILEREARDPRVELVRGNFGSVEVAARIGAADAVVMFDVLLHQVAPDWDEVLGMYARQTRCMVLSGPWWRGPETVRLLDLGREEYLATVPLPDFHRPILDRLDEVNTERGRPWRDVHDIWQWGITDRDLRARMKELGFRLEHYEHSGLWGGHDRFDDGSYVFVRSR